MVAIDGRGDDAHTYNKSLLLFQKRTEWEDGKNIERLEENNARTEKEGLTEMAVVKIKKKSKERRRKKEQRRTTSNTKTTRKKSVKVYARNEEVATL